MSNADDGPQTTDDGRRTTDHGPRTTDVGGPCLLEYDSLPSTMDVARECVAAGRREVVGVRTGFQEAGRGRRGREWVAPPGECLLITYILYGEDCRAEVAGRLAFVAAVAVADAIRAQTGLAPRVKWPNDVRLGNRKVCGILIETATTDSENRKSEPAALVGIGLNVNVALFTAELEALATSLLRESGRVFEVEAVEEEVRRALWATREAAARHGFVWLLNRWRELDSTPGMLFRTTLDGGTVDGIVTGVSDAGALILRTDSGVTIEALSASSVEE